MNISYKMKDTHSIIHRLREEKKLGGLKKGFFLKKGNRTHIKFVLCASGNGNRKLDGENTGKDN